VEKKIRNDLVPVRLSSPSVTDGIEEIGSVHRPEGDVQKYLLVFLKKVWHWDYAATWPRLVVWYSFERPANEYSAFGSNKDTSINPFKIAAFYHPLIFLYHLAISPRKLNSR
jgi:hypothetical protein